MTDPLSQRMHITLALDAEMREPNPCKGFIEACHIALRILDYELKSRVALHIELSQPQGGKDEI